MKNLLLTVAIAFALQTSIATNLLAQGTIEITPTNVTFTSTGSTSGTLSITFLGRQGATYASGGTGGLFSSNLRYDLVVVTNPVGTFTLNNSSGVLSNVNSTILTGSVTNTSPVPTYAPQGTSPTGTNASIGFTLTRNNTTDPDLPVPTASRATLFTVTYNYTVPSGNTIASGTIVQRTLTGSKGSSWSSFTNSGNAFLQGTATALPIELTDFNAANNGDNRALLQWATVKEQNTASFEVQRAADGDNFNTTVAKVRAAGKSSSLLKYQSYDEQPLAGANYYRLKMIDADGKFTYSAIRKVVFNGKSPEVVVYPTENYDGLVHVNLPQEWAEAQLNLYNAAGQLVTAPVDGISLTRTVQLTSLPAGVYTLKVSDTKNSQAFRISYQR